LTALVAGIASAKIKSRRLKTIFKLIPSNTVRVIGIAIMGNINKVIISMLFHFWMLANRVHEALFRASGINNFFAFRIPFTAVNAFTHKHPLFMELTLCAA
jgi:hypothetical protein